MKKQIFYILLIILLANSVYSLTINKPTDSQNIYNTLSLTLNTSAINYTNATWYSWNNVVNYTLCSTGSDCSDNETIITIPRQGYYNISVWANDSLGNITSEIATNVFVGNKTDLDNASIIADLKVGNILEPEYYTTIMRWDISTLGLEDKLIKRANMMLFIYNIYFSFGRNITIYRGKDYTWNESSSASDINLIAQDIETNTTMTSETDDTYTLFNVTEIVNADKNQNSTTFRIYDSRYVQPAVIWASDNTGLYIGSEAYYAFCDRENSCGWNKSPYLNISYYNTNQNPNTTNIIANNTKLNTTNNHNFTYQVSDDNDYVINATLFVNNIPNASTSQPSLDVQNSISFNASSGTYDMFIRSYDSDGVYNDSTSYVIRINSPPTMTSLELNKTSGVTDSNVLNCTAIGIADTDSEDIVTYNYEWYKNSVAQGYNNASVGSSEFTAGDQWYCEAHVTDNYLNSSKYTSSTIAISSSYVAPSIDFINATTGSTGINSTAINPTNNNSWINLSVTFTDANTELWTAYFCTTPTWSNCLNNVSGTTLCISTKNSTEKTLNCKIDANRGSSGTNNYYTFVQDNNTFVSTGRINTYNLNLFPNTPTLTNNTFVNNNWFLINFTSTDADNDLLNYTIYGNSSTDTMQQLQSSNLSYYNWTGLSDGVYYTKAYSTDEHAYSSLVNSSIFIFTVDSIDPQLSVTSPTHDSIYNSQLVSLTISATDINLNKCYYDIYYKDTGTLKESDYDIGCSGTTFLSAPYYSGGYNLKVYVNDSAGNTDSTEINFTTVAPASSTPQLTGGGSTGGTETIIVVKEGNFTMETESGSDSYNIIAIPGSNITKLVCLTNLGGTATTLSMSCLGENNSICEWISFSDKQVTLLPNKNIKKCVDVNIAIPKNAKYGAEYYFSVIASDQEGNKGALGFTVNLGRVVGYVQEFFRKLIKPWKTIPFSKWKEGTSDLGIANIFPILAFTILIPILFYLILSKLPTLGYGLFPFFGIFIIGPIINITRRKFRKKRIKKLFADIIQINKIWTPIWVFLVVTIII